MITRYHFNLSKLLMATGFMLSFFQISYSQVYGKKETIEYINRKLAGSCVIEINAATIIAKYYSENGNEIRQDKVSTGALDTTILYDSSNQLLSIPCLSVEGDCVTRKLYVQKIKRTYARISFVVQNEKVANELKIAFKHLIRLLSEPNYDDKITLY